VDISGSAQALPLIFCVLIQDLLTSNNQGLSIPHRSNSLTRVLATSIIWCQHHLLSVPLVCSILGFIICFISQPTLHFMLSISKVDFLKKKLKNNVHLLKYISIAN
jgi:hypothetical protein